MDEHSERQTHRDIRWATLTSLVFVAAIVLLYAVIGSGSTFDGYASRFYSFLIR